MPRKKKRIAFIGSVTKPIAPELQPLVPRGVELVGYRSRVALFPHTPLERMLQELGHAEAAFTATEEGCDAIVIDSVGDYGLEAMRASLPIPAIGAGEAGMAAAAAAGQRFAVVTVWPPSMNFVVQARLRGYGHSESCTAIFNVGAEEDLQGPGGTGGYLSQVRRGQKSIRDKIEQSIAAAAAAGADAILLGCTCMSALAASLAAVAPVPVVNPLAEALAAALKSKRVAPPRVRMGPRELLRKMVDASADQALEPCPYCVVGDKQ